MRGIDRQRSAGPVNGGLQLGCIEHAVRAGCNHGVGVIVEQRGRFKRTHRVVRAIQFAVKAVDHEQLLGIEQVIHTHADVAGFLGHLSGVLADTQHRITEGMHARRAAHRIAQCNGLSGLFTGFQIEEVDVAVLACDDDLAQCLGVLLFLQNVGHFADFFAPLDDQRLTGPSNAVEDGFPAALDRGCFHLPEFFHFCDIADSPLCSILAEGRSAECHDAVRLPCIGLAVGHIDDVLCGALIIRSLLGAVVNHSTLDQRRIRAGISRHHEFRKGIRRFRRHRCLSRHGFLNHRFRCGFLDNHFFIHDDRVIRSHIDSRRRGHFQGQGCNGIVDQRCLGCIRCLFRQQILCRLVGRFFQVLCAAVPVLGHVIDRIGVIQIVYHHGFFIGHFDVQRFFRGHRGRCHLRPFRRGFRDNRPRNFQCDKLVGVHPDIAHIGLSPHNAGICLFEGIVQRPDPGACIVDENGAFRRDRNACLIHQTDFCNVQVGRHGEGNIDRCCPLGRRCTEIQNIRADDRSRGNRGCLHDRLFRDRDLLAQSGVHPFRGKDLRTDSAPVGLLKRNVHRPLDVARFKRQRADFPGDHLTVCIEKTHIRHRRTGCHGECQFRRRIGRRGVHRKLRYDLRRILCRCGRRLSAKHARYGALGIPEHALCIIRDQEIAGSEKPQNQNHHQNSQQPSGQSSSLRDFLFLNRDSGFHRSRRISGCRSIIGFSERFLACIARSIHGSSQIRTALGSLRTRIPLRVGPVECFGARRGQRPFLLSCCSVCTPGMLSTRRLHVLRRNAEGLPGGRLRVSRLNGRPGHFSCRMHRLRCGQFDLLIV